MPGFFIVVVKKNGFHVVINIKNDSAAVIKQERGAFQSVGKRMEKRRFFLVFSRFHNISLWYHLSMSAEYLMAAGKIKKRFKE